MLICPQCGFGNPDENKFCQKCGGSLIHQSCPACGAQVALAALDCPECGTRTGRVWLAVITPQASIETEDETEIQVGMIPNPSPCPQASETEHLSGATTQLQGAERSTLDMIRLESTVSALEPRRSEPKLSFEINLTKKPEPSADVDLNLGAEVTAPNPSETKDSEVNIDSEIDNSDIDHPEMSVPGIGYDAGDLETSAVESNDSVTDDNVWLRQTFDASEIPAQDALSSQNDQEFEQAPTPWGFLDTQRRYQVIHTGIADPLPRFASNTETIVAAVLDCQPLKLSPFEAIRSGSLTSDSSIDASMKSALLIPMAQAYLSLHTQHPQIIPRLHDAWTAPAQTVVLLEDYSQRSQLVDHLRNPETSLSQIVHWLQNITGLWTALEPWKCRQSLLETANLRVAPHPSYQLCLQRLYPEKPETDLSLQDLGQHWRLLLQESQRTLFGRLTHLVQDLSEGKIQTADQLQAELAIALQEIEPDNISLVGVNANGAIQRNTLIELETEVSAQPTNPLFHLSRLEAFGQTDVGQQRDHNEDFFSVQTFANHQQTPIGQVAESKGLYILCDGMGGHAGGEVASQLAVDTLQRYFQSQWVGELPTAETLKEGILHANETLYEMNQQDTRSGAGRMGTTLAMLMVADAQVAVAHVGDSRVYRLTASKGLEQITVDHEVGQREIERGVAPDVAYMRPDAYQLTQALGPRDAQFLRPTVNFLDLTEDTLFIIASDGLTDNDLLENHQTSYLKPLLDHEANLEVGVQQLTDLANQKNGHDNITVIVVRATIQS
ncbi:MAG: serine/threonine phosphatase [Microcoleaceae cyanobacterium]